MVVTYGLTEQRCNHKYQKPKILGTYVDPSSYLGAVY